MAFGIPDSELTYGSYLRVGHLTQLQELQSDPPQHDELLFIIIHQVYELWFKQLLHELGAVTARLDEDKPLGAHRLLQRCVEIQRVLTAQITVLETMTPNDFLTFRDRLMPASGFQSAQFRALEFVCGRKSRRHVDAFEAGSPERALLERCLASPTLGERFHALLARRGIVAGEGDGLAALYQRADEHYDLYLLAEAMIEFDASFHIWRLRHVVMVERMIGAKPGTGGSEGVAYLKTTLDSKFFPELWDLRSELGA